MIMRLRTSGDTENKLSELDRRIKLSSKAALMRIAIACSLKNAEDPRIEDCNDVKSIGGADYQRLTIFGQQEELFRLLMVNHMGRQLTDEEFFPDLTGAHIRRGINFMYSEYLFIDNRDKFFEKLINLGK